MLISRAARSLSSRFGATRATLATRAIAGGGAHPAPPLPHREGELDKEREREETRRDSRGNSRELDVSRLDAEAEKGPIEKSLHSAKGKIKEAVGSATEKVSHTFTSEGAIGREFEKQGAIGSMVHEAVEGPFKAKGAVGEQFRSDGAVGGTVEAAAEAGQESGEQIEKEGEKEEAKK